MLTRMHARTHNPYGGAVQDSLGLSSDVILPVNHWCENCGDYEETMMKCPGELCDETICEGCFEDLVPLARAHTRTHICKRTCTRLRPRPCQWTRTYRRSHTHALSHTRVPSRTYESNLTCVDLLLTLTRLWYSLAYLFSLASAATANKSFAAPA